MAPSSSISNLNRLYKQTKKKTTKSKSTMSSSSRTRTTKKSKKQSTSDVIPQDDYEANEVILRQFDMNMAYGPCVGMSRLDRWERAKAMGLNPPEEVLNLLKSGQVQQQSLWNDSL